MADQTTNLGLVKPAYTETADVGVINDNMDIIDAAFLSHVYPVGSIYMSVNSADPGTLFGGTWEQLKDRFLLGAGDTYTAGATGGSATHTLTTAEIPSHNHTFTGTAVTSGNNSVNHTHTGTSGNPSANHTHSGPNHKHGYWTQYRLSANNIDRFKNGNAIAGGWGEGGGASLGQLGIWMAIPEQETYNAGTGATGSVSAWHTHTTTTGNQSANHTHSVTAAGSIGNTGGGDAFSIMPPYLAVYMWKRTA